MYKYAYVTLGDGNLVDSQVNLTFEQLQDALGTEDLSWHSEEAQRKQEEFYALLKEGKDAELYEDMANSDAISDTAKAFAALLGIPGALHTTVTVTEA